MKMSPSCWMECSISAPHQQPNTRPTLRANCLQSTSPTAPYIEVESVVLDGVLQLGSFPWLPSQPHSPQNPTESHTVANRWTNCSWKKAVTTHTGPCLTLRLSPSCWMECSISAPHQQPTTRPTYGAKCSQSPSPARSLTLRLSPSCWMECSISSPQPLTRHPVSSLPIYTPRHTHTHNM
jgi:hypothetical protein